MSKIKVLLSVVEGMRSLADSMAELADVIATGEESTSGSMTSGGNATQTAPDTPHGAENARIESQQGASTKPVREALQPQNRQSTQTTAQQPAAQEDGGLKFDLVTLRAAVAEYSTPENRTKIKEILNRFGVRKLTELKEEQYQLLFNEVLEACEK